MENNASEGKMVILGHLTTTVTIHVKNSRIGLNCRTVQTPGTKIVI